MTEIDWTKRFWGLGWTPGRDSWEASVPIRLGRHGDGWRAWSDLGHGAGNDIRGGATREEALEALLGPPVTVLGMRYYPIANSEWLGTEYWPDTLGAVRIQDRYGEWSVVGQSISARSPEEAIKSYVDARTQEAARNTRAAMQTLVSLRRQARYFDL